MKNILALLPVPGEKYEKKIVEAALENEVRFVTKDTVSAQDVEWANIVIGNLPTGLLNDTKFDFVQLTSAGADVYVKPGVLNSETILTCCTGAYSQTVAEHALATTLMLLKKLHLYRDDQMNSDWADEGTTGTIDGATILVMGLGDIGCYYARMAKALGAYVIGVKRRATDKPDCVDELYTTEQFDEVVGRADIIMSVLPGTPATTYFYTIDRFKKMKDSAIFINCGRGNAVSMDMLYEALSNNMISCAGVDVFEIEPLPKDSKLWGLKNLAITPHASGFFHLPATIDRVIDISAKNLTAFLNGGELRNVIDFKTGYKN